VAKGSVQSEMTLIWAGSSRRLRLWRASCPRSPVLTCHLERNNGGEFGGFFLLGYAKQIVVLKAHPVFGFISEIAPQLEAVLGSEHATTGKYVIQELRADMEILGKPGLSQTIILQKIAEHGGGGVGERDSCFHDGSMVVGDFHFGGAGFFPAEDDSPLAVDADGMEAIKITAQGLKAVPGRVAEVIQRFGFMDGNELVIGALLNFMREFAGIFQIEDLPALFVSETQNHRQPLLKSA